MSRNTNIELLKDAILSIYEAKSNSSNSYSYNYPKAELLIGRFKATAGNASAFSINLFNSTEMTENNCVDTYSIVNLKALSSLTTECLGIAYELISSNEFYSK